MACKKRVIGIVGGLGPEASAVLYLNIVKRALKADPTQYPSIALWSVPITKVSWHLSEITYMLNYNT